MQLATVGPMYRRRRPVGRRALTLTCLIVFALGLGSASAAADTLAPYYAQMEQRFAHAGLGTWTGWSFDGANWPVAPGVQPPPQREATFVFPRGTRFDLSHARNCGASDERITRRGIAVCPAASRAGYGAATLFVGAGGYLDVQAHFFVARPGFVLAFTNNAGNVLRVLRGTVSGRRVSTTIPAIALPGGYEVAVTRLALRMVRFGTRRHPGLRTPSRCPKSGRWVFTYLPRYDAPHGVQRSTSSVRCD